MIGKLPWETQVKLVQDASDPRRPAGPTIAISNPSSGIGLDARQAQDFAELLKDLANACTQDELRELAAEVHAAAAFIDPARQLAATAAETSTDREME